MDVQSSTQLVSIGAIVLAIIALARDFLRNRGEAQHGRDEVARVLAEKDAEVAKTLAAKDAEIARVLAAKDAEVAKLRETAEIESDRRRDETQHQLLTMFAKQIDSGLILNGVVQKLQEGAVKREARQGEIQEEQVRQGETLEALQSGVLGANSLLRDKIVPAVIDVPLRIEANAKTLDTLTEVIKTLPTDVQEKLKPDLANLFKEVDEIKAHLVSIGEKFDTFEAKIMRAIADVVPAKPPDAPNATAIAAETA